MRGGRARATQRPHLGPRLTLPRHLVTVPLDGRDADLLSLDLWTLGAVGIEETPAGLRAAFPDDDDARRARDRLAPSATIETVAETTGLDEHRPHLTVERAGPFTVRPPWLPADGGAIDIVVDPGHAFGSGSHPSTRLALTLLPDLLDESSRVADIGCGSGVLSIAAARLGATVIAVDVDAAAVAAATTNVEANAVGDRVSVIAGGPLAIGAPVDVALVNVTIDIHEAIAGDVAAPIVVVSGLLTDHLDRAARAYEADGEHQVDEDGWTAAVLRRRAGWGGRRGPA